MNITINNIDYPVEIVKKGNKNTYIRYIPSKGILVTTSFFTTKGQVLRLLKKQESRIHQMIIRQKKREKSDHTFSYLGKEYDIMITSGKEIVFSDEKIMVPSLSILEKWVKKQSQHLFSARLQVLFPKFQEKIPVPKLAIRKMKTKWGVCNRRTTIITLNTELLGRTLEEIDYVIIHELAHFVEFNHSPAFWKVVEKYCPKYKEIRKKLRGD